MIGVYLPATFLFASNKYYLTYQTETKTHNPKKKQGCGINVIAMWAETPDGSV